MTSISYHGEPSSNVTTELTTGTFYHATLKNDKNKVEPKAHKTSQ